MVFSARFLAVVGLIYGAAVCPRVLATEPSVDASMDLRAANLGDPVQLVIKISHPSGWTVLEEPLPEALGDARVLSQRWDAPPESSADGSTVTTVLSASLAWYRLGDSEVPAVPIEVVSPDGESTRLESPALSMTIEPFLDEGDEKTAPSKGQVDMNVPALWPWILAGVFLIALIAAGVIFWFLRRERPAAKPKPVKPPEPPYREAIDALNALTMSSLLKEGLYKEFYVQIVLIVRHYYARLWQVHAEEWTTFELEEWLAGRNDLPDGLIELNNNFHGRADLVKFAKYDPVEAETKEVVNQAYQIVEVLKPREDHHVAAS